MSKNYYQEGYLAYLEGKYHFQYPDYPTLNEKAKWVRGWTDAMEDRQSIEEANKDLQQSDVDRIRRRLNLSNYDLDVLKRFFNE